MNGLISYDIDADYKSYYINFFPKIDFFNILRELNDKELIDIDSCLFEVGYGDHYKAYEKNDLGKIKTVGDLRKVISSLGNELFIQKFDFYLSGQVHIHIYEDFNYEIKSLEGKYVDKFFEVFFKLLDLDYIKINDLMTMLKGNVGKYLVVDEVGNVKTVYEDFDSYLSSLPNSPTGAGL